MATNFPTSLDTFVAIVPGVSGTVLSGSGNPGLIHSTQHNNANDAITAIEAKIGVTGSSVTSSLDYQTRTLRIDLQSLSSSLAGRVTTNTTSITTLSGVVATDVNNLSGRITTLSGVVATDVNSLRTSINTLTASAVSFAAISSSLNGASSNIGINNKAFENVGWVDFQLSASVTHKEGRLFYDTDDKSMAYMNDRNGPVLQIGRELWVRVRNTTGATIPNGSAVYINGAHASGFPTVALARADSASTADVIGLVTEDILNNGEGLVTTVGVVRDIDTSAFSVGNKVYLSPSVAGALTATAPSGTNVSIEVATVVRANPNGRYYVSPRLGRVYGNPADVAVSGTMGTSSSLARSDHAHSLPFTVVRDVLSGAHTSMSFNHQLLTRVANPTSSQDVATKVYTDTILTAVSSSVATDIFGVRYLKITTVTGSRALTTADINSLIDADTTTAGGNITLTISGNLFVTGSTINVAKKGTGGNVILSGANAMVIRGSTTITTENAVAAIIIINTGSCLTMGNFA